MTDGIHIPREVAAAEGLPDDLDANVTGPYRFPDPRRRRIAAVIYALAAVPVASMGAGRLGAWVVVGLLVALAGEHALAAWPLGHDQDEVLTRTRALTPFPLGHASAAVGFRGLRARPVWQVIVYSADDPPTERALVQLDGVSGEPCAEVYTERIPRP